MDALDNILDVRGVYKSYDSETVVFKGLNMTVQRGTIHALLGPSGCGKTTLLKCILGRKHIDAGEIILKRIKNRSQIGYMPQDISLIGELSIKDTLSYYGWIYSVTGKALEERKRLLYSCLDIPSESSIINKCSGGQKRRISMCLALIHNPELLILDEPTVGIDPILNQSIWEYLLDLSTVQKKTIILTTHYIEEARKSNKVSMMRGGVIVLEGEPETIIEKYGCNTLEEVFTMLSYQQDSKSRCGDNEKENYLPGSSVKQNYTLKDEKLISLNGFIGFLLKNLYFLKYSSIGWFLLFFIPISSSILFQYSLGRSPVGITVGIINDELLHKHGNCDNFSNVTCFPASCIYVSLLKKKGILTVPYDDMNIAHINTAKGNVYAFIHFSENFTESLYERIWENFSVTAGALEKSEINIWIDMSNKIIATFLKNTLHNLYFNYLENLSLNCMWPVEHAMIPIKFMKPVYGKSIPEFSEFSVPGILLMLEFFLPVAYLFPVLQEKRDGIIERSLISGLTNLEILTAYATMTMMLFALQTACNVVIFYGIYDHVFEGNAILALLLLCLVGISGMCFGLFAAVLYDREFTAALFVIGAFICSCITSSLFWTPEGMHNLLKSFCWLLPLTLSAEAYRAITTKSWTLFHPVVYKGFISTISWAFVFCFAAYVVIKIRKGIGHVN